MITRFCLAVGIPFLALMFYHLCLRAYLTSTRSLAIGLALAYMAPGLVAMVIDQSSTEAGSRKKLRAALVGIVLVVRRVTRRVLGSKYSAVLEAITAIIVVTLLMSAAHVYKPSSLLIACVVSAGSGIVVWIILRGARARYLRTLIDPGFFQNATDSQVIHATDSKQIHATDSQRIPANDSQMILSNDSQRIISELVESLLTTTNLDHLLELFATCVLAALQTKNVTIFLQDNATGDYLSYYSSDYNEADDSLINRDRQSLLPFNAEFLKRLTDTMKPLYVEQYIALARHGSDNETAMDVEKAGLQYRDVEEGVAEQKEKGVTEQNEAEQKEEGLTDQQEDIESVSISPISPISPINEITDDEIELLRELKSTLLLPLTIKGDTIGVVSLGPRIGDLPYSIEDEHLLMSMSGPAAYAIENTLMVEQMIEESGLRQELEAENEIRANALESARQLQLSMLPRAIPQLPHLEIAAYMKTGAEVGGDYYDFYLSDDGVLTAAIGDANGRGLKAGTVVTATKSLFNHLAQESDIPTIFQWLSRALKRMNLRSSFMALTIVKVKDYQLTLGSAGMPPVLIYHAGQGVVEEISLMGVPLGSLTAYSYCELSLSLGPGDIVVLMSNGYPERFNGNNEMLDYENAKTVLPEIAVLQPQEIIDIFVKIGDKWAAGRPQDDDLTLVVMKFR